MRRSILILVDLFQAFIMALICGSSFGQSSELLNLKRGILSDIPPVLKEIENKIEVYYFEYFVFSYINARFPVWWGLMM